MLAPDKASILEDALLNRKGTRKDKEIIFKCPIHKNGDEVNPSATYNTEKQVWICHACGTKGGYADLCRYLGLNLTTFGNGSSIPKSSSSVSNNSSKDWLTLPWWRLEKINIHPVATYDYTDANNKLLYQVGRFEHEGKKTFRQRKPKSKGWSYKLADGQKVLFRLLRVLEALSRGEAVYICEGEKDVLRLEKLGLIATCNVGGAGKWLEQYTGLFKGACAVLFEDNDEAGRKHVHKVKASLQKVVAELRVINFRDLPEKSDVSDFLDSFPEDQQLEKLLERVATAKVIKPELKAPKRYTGNNLRGLEIPETNFTLNNILPVGLSILSAKPKIGKSWFALDLAVAISTANGTFLNESPEQGDVFYLALEDNPRRMKSRMECIFPDKTVEWPERLEFQHELEKLDEGGLIEIEQWLEEKPEGKLVIIDTMQKVMPRKSQVANDYEYSVEHLGTLQRLAHQYGVSILLIHHERKNVGVDVFDGMLGSVGYAASTDANLVLKRERMQADAVLHITGKDVEEKELALDFEAKSGLWIIKGKVNELRLPPEQFSALEAVKSGHDTPSKVGDVIGKSRTHAQNLLTILLDKGLLDKAGYGKYSIILKNVPTNPDDSLAQKISLPEK